MVQELAAYTFPHGNVSGAVAGGQNLPMPLHRAIFALGFLCFELVHICTHGASIKRVMLVVLLLNSSICYFSFTLSQTKHK
jgi:hypothetical protein